MGEVGGGVLRLAREPTYQHGRSVAWSDQAKGKDRCAPTIADCLPHIVFQNGVCAKLLGAGEATEWSGGILLPPCPYNRMDGRRNVRTAAEPGVGPQNRAHGRRNLRRATAPGARPCAPTSITFLRYTFDMEIALEEIIAFLRESHLFTKLPDDQLAAAAEHVEVFSVPAGEMIYKPGMKSDGLYFIYQGKIQIGAQPVKGSSGVSRLLSSGDYFGEEALVYGQARLTQACARVDTIVMRVTKRSLDRWIDDFPLLITPLRLAEESFLLTYNRRFSWLAKGERIKYACRRTRFVLWKKLLTPALLLSILLTLTFYLGAIGSYLPAVVTAVLLVMIAPWVAWLAADWMNDFLVLTNHRIVSQEKVILLYDSRQETPLEAVQSFGVETDQWGRWFGFGSIAVRSFTGSQLLTGIENPPEVVNILEEMLARNRSRQKEEDRKAAEAAVRMRLGLDTAEQAEEQLPEKPAAFFQSGVLPGWIANLFRMRIQAGDTIIYRTHWILLLRTIFIPTLIMIVIPTLAVDALAQGVELVSPDIIVLVSAVMWAVAFAIWIYRYADWHNDCYMITPDQVVDINRKPLGMEDRRTASYSSILGIEFTRKGLLGLLFNYGTVNIKIGDSNFTFDNVYNPSAVQQELFQKLNTYTLQTKKAEAEQERERMADFIETYHNLYRGDQKPLEEDAKGG
jgi:hypothetical protein